MDQGQGQGQRSGPTDSARGVVKRALVAATAALIGTGAVLTAAASAGFADVGGKGAQPSPSWPVTAASVSGLPGAIAEVPVPQLAWVSVPVATVWAHPATARPEDVDAVSGHPDVAVWLRGLSYEQKLGLDDLLDTQLLLDQPVTVEARSGSWVEVTVANQKGSVFPHGIEGWVPASQISTTPPPPGQLHATVAVPVLEAGGAALSYGTELPAQRDPDGSVTLLMPGGRAAVAAKDVRTAPLAPSGNTVVAEARRFVGLQYLWAGTSAFGFDCSGLTYTVYRQLGIELPRDAADQAQAGRSVAWADMRPGDLVFFAFEPTIDHVGIYAGDGMMIDAPHTGAAIEEVPLSTLRSAFAGARRYTRA